MKIDLLNAGFDEVGGRTVLLRPAPLDRCLVATCEYYRITHGDLLNGSKLAWDIREARKCAVAVLWLLTNDMSLHEMARKVGYAGTATASQAIKTMQKQLDLERDRQFQKCVFRVAGRVLG